MFCDNCGTENSRDAKFCKKCGHPLKNDEGKKDAPSAEGQSEVTSTPAKAGTSEKNTNELIEKIKALPRKVQLGMLGGAVLLVIIIVFALNSGKTINMDKYITFETTGYSGYGKVNATIDWTAIEAKYGKKVSYAGELKSRAKEVSQFMSPIDVLEASVSVAVDPNKKLSNGDAVSYTWDIPDDLNNYLNCKVKATDGTYTVSGLTELETFDAFADLEVEFSEVAPDGRVNLNYTGEELQPYDFSCDKMNGLSNGDVVTVSISDSNMEYYAETLGKIPAESEKQYTVEGLQSYVTKFSQIDDAAMEEMKNQATDVFNADVASRWGKDETLETLTYIGDYFLVVKNTAMWGYENQLYLVYKAQVHNDYTCDRGSYNEVNDIYWYISFQNLLVSEDGKVEVDTSDYGTTYDSFEVDSGVADSWGFTKGWHYRGYESLSELYKKVVTAQADDYNHEDNVDEEVEPEAAAEEEALTVEGDYVLPNSDTEEISREDLEGLTAEQCKIARNEIYARHGRKFRDEELQKYFDSLDWYQGTIEPDDFNESDLSSLEIKNKDQIVAYEEEMGYK